MPQPGLAAAQEYRLTPHFTTDTQILILKDGVAGWTPIGKAWIGANVIQSLPSGNIGDVKGARLAVLEQVWHFKRGLDDSDIIQIGMAGITANHPILIDKEWILASQAAAKGLGKFPDRECSQLCGLQLVTGGNILLNISTSQDMPPVYTEAATMGYCFLSPSDPLNGNSPTYDLQWTGPHNDYRAQTRPSYSRVTTLHHKGISTRPILPPTATHASPKASDNSKMMTKEYGSEPRTGTFATVHLSVKTTQRTPEEHSSDLSHQGISGPILPRVPTPGLDAGVDRVFPTTSLRIKRIMSDAGLSHREKTLLVTAIWQAPKSVADRSTSSTNLRTGSRPPATLPDPAMNALVKLEVPPIDDTTDITPPVTSATETLADSGSVPNPQPEGTGILTHPDILIQTPGG